MGKDSAKRGRPRLGRPTKLTPEVGNAILRSIRLGNYVEIAARLNEVHPTTVFGWMRRGAKEKKGVYAEFFIALKKAQAQAEERLLLKIEAAAKKDWKAAAWRLEKMRPSVYKDRYRFELTGRGGRPIEHIQKRTVDDYTDEELAKIVAGRSE